MRVFTEEERKAGQEKRKKKIEEYVKMNPTWSCRALIGTLLEAL